LGEQGASNLGHLITVRIKARPEEMLDFDKPLSKQTPQVQDAVLGVRFKGNAADIAADIAAAKSSPEYMNRSVQALLSDLPIRR
jgi:hypothetical protein